MNIARTYRLATLVLILGCTAGCDQTSKYIARSQLTYLGHLTLPGGFGELRLAENRGSFLSLMGLLSLFAYLVISPLRSWMSFIGLAVVWAGGMSNLIDRIIRQGQVTDFIFIRVGPLHTGIFNAADLMIVIGIAALFHDMWRRRYRRKSVKALKDQP